MVVRFYDKENMYSGDNAAYAATTAATATTSSTNATPITDTLNHGNTMNFQKSGSLREIVGNCKEVRIEDNLHNLRIVGNNNRIRIALNVGDITVIGNNTRLKIKTNHGLIKYTGNDGRIVLGKESTEQLVDYSGCNGVLKVQNSKKSSQQVNADNGDDGDDEMINNSAAGGICSRQKLDGSKKQKYASSPSVSEVFKSHNKCHRKGSMPNMTTNPFLSDNVSSSNCVHPLPNFGNIVIANSSNICISPYAYTY